MREIITLQLGNFSNFLGAHFWNIQDSTLAEELGADGEPVVHPGHAEPSVLYRRAEGAGARRRLVLCDGADRFGSHRATPSCTPRRRHRRASRAASTAGAAW